MDIKIKLPKGWVIDKESKESITYSFNDVREIDSGCKYCGNNFIDETKKIHVVKHDKKYKKGKWIDKETYIINSNINVHHKLNGRLLPKEVAVHHIKSLMSKTNSK